MVMIESLEARRLLSVPHIAGHWVGAVGRSIDGGPSQKGHVTIVFAQQGKFVSCAESDTYDPSITYCRGTIDSKGNLKLKWSPKRSMRPIFGSGVGKLSHGKINFLLTGSAANGSTLLLGFRIHRG